MGSRIVVVLSQSSVQVLDRRDLEEDIVGELLGAEGIELTIVPHLKDLDSDGTGRLCLEGISTDMIVLSWLEPQEAHAALSRHGIGGRFGHPNSRDTDASSTTQPAASLAAQIGADNGRRTVYHVDLKKIRSAAILRQEVCRIRDEAAARPVDPLLVIPHRSDDSGGPVARVRVQLSDGSSEVVAPARHSVTADGDMNRSNREEERRTRSTAPARAAAERTTNDELDDLLDQFDNLEL
jgi:hypothetical protein